MQQKTLSVIVFLTGIAISGIAAYYSIVGLTAIFAGAFWSIVFMGVALEIGKLVSISWLYNNRNAPFLIKTYFVSAIVVLMIITSVGIFGFLSKSHIEQQVNINTGVTEQISLIDTELKIHDEVINSITRQLEQINSAIEKLNEKGQSKTSLNEMSRQKKTRDDLFSEKQKETRKQIDLKTKRIKLESEIKKVEAEIGPIKYVAELFFDASDTKVVDKTIRYVIIMLIFVFDPLAVLLLLAFNISITKDNIPEFLDLSIEEKNDIQLPINKNIVQPETFAKQNIRPKKQQKKPKQNNGDEKERLGTMGITIRRQRVQNKKVND